MTKKEFATFVCALKTYYSKEEKLLANDQAMELWYEQLKDIPYKVAELALNQWVATNKWSPAISDIRAYAAGIAMGDIPDWGEGWETVLESIRRYGYYRQSEGMRYIADHNRIAFRCTERIGYETLCLSENIGIERANFRNMYEQYAERERIERQIPGDIQMAIDRIRQPERMAIRKEFQ